MSKEHDLQCKDIAEELQKYYNGEFYIYDGEIFEELETYLGDDGFYYVDVNGEPIMEDEFNPVSLCDFFRDFYNLEWVLDSNKEVIAVRVMVACGGPNIYINTWDKQVELYWWGETGKAYLERDICEEITQLFIDYAW